MTKQQFYAGIGSRKTPSDILKFMEKIGIAMAKKGWDLRSGNALGADQAFQRGGNQLRPEQVHVFLPWQEYEKAALHSKNKVYAAPKHEAYTVAAQYHPRWKFCSPGERRLHARNSHIILGENLDSPVQQIICWTPEGKLVGGTSQALRISQDYQIPIYNLASPENLNFICRSLQITSPSNQLEFLW